MVPDIRKLTVRVGKAALVALAMALRLERLCYMSVLEDVTFVGASCIAL